MYLISNISNYSTVAHRQAPGPGLTSHISTKLIHRFLNSVSGNNFIRLPLNQDGAELDRGAPRSRLVNDYNLIGQKKIITPVAAAVASGPIDTCHWTISA